MKLRGGRKDPAKHRSLNSAGVSGYLGTLGQGDKVTNLRGPVAQGQRLIIQGLPIKPHREPQSYLVCSEVDMGAGLNLHILPQADSIAPRIHQEAVAQVAQDVAVFRPVNGHTQEGQPLIIGIPELAPSTPPPTQAITTNDQASTPTTPAPSPLTAIQHLRHAPPKRRGANN